MAVSSGGQQADQQPRDLAETMAFLQEMFTAMFDPAADESTVDRFFTEDYTQYVDGHELDRAAFLEHLGVLRGLVAEIEFEFQELVVSDDMIGERHLVKLTKTDGSMSVSEVHAFHHLRGDRVARIVELTRLAEGSDDDHDLGSRR